MSAVDLHAAIHMLYLPLVFHVVYSSAFHRFRDEFLWFVERRGSDAYPKVCERFYHRDGLCRFRSVHIYPSIWRNVLSDTDTCWLDRNNVHLCRRICCRFAFSLQIALYFVLMLELWQLNHSLNSFHRWICAWNHARSVMYNNRVFPCFSRTVLSRIHICNDSPYFQGDFWFKWSWVSHGGFLEPRKDSIIGMSTFFMMSVVYH